MKNIAVTSLVCAISLALAIVPAGAGSKKAKPKKPVVVHDKAMMATLRSIVIKHIELEDVTPSAVFKLLRMESKNADPKGKGVNFIITGGVDKTGQRVTLTMDDVPLAYLIRYVCMAAGLDYVAEKYAVVIKPKQKKNKPAPVK